MLGVDLSSVKPHQSNEVFERFAVLHILRRHVPDLSVEDLDFVSTGDVHDNQLDAVAFVWEGKLIADSAEAMTLIESEEQLDLELVVIQITRSKRFNREKIGSFIRGLHSFLSDAPYFRENPMLAQMRVLKDRIRQECREREVPLRLRVHGYYAADSNLPKDSDSNLPGDFAQGRAILLDAKGVDEAELEPVDRRRLSDMVAVDRNADAYGTALAPYSGFAPKTFLTRLPSNPGSGECWIGAIDFSSFLMLLTREDGQGLREGVFEHNVRGFLPESDVNARIKETLLSPERAHFALFNNGVTIVSETILSAPPPVSGGEQLLRLTNYQVVNGLQTTHVLYGARAVLAESGDKLFVPVKLVATNDEDLRRRIVVATNRQNPIAGLALHANDRKTLEIQDRIRAREAEAGEEWPMIFERRAGLSDRRRRAKDAQRVDLGDALRAFVAVFLGQPHKAETGLKPTLELVGDRVLVENHEPGAYLVSALLLAQARRLIERTEDAALIHEFAPFEHHLAFALRLLIEPRPAPAAHSPEAPDYCEALERNILRQELIDRAFERAIRAVRSARQKVSKSRFRRPMEKSVLSKQVALEAQRERRNG